MLNHFCLNSSQKYPRTTGILKSGQAAAVLKCDPYELCWSKDGLIHSFCFKLIKALHTCPCLSDQFVNLIKHANTFQFILLTTEKTHYHSLVICSRLYIFVGCYRFTFVLLFSRLIPFQLFNLGLSQYLHPRIFHICVHALVDLFLIFFNWISSSPLCSADLQLGSSGGLRTVQGHLPAFYRLFFHLSKILDFFCNHVNNLTLIQGGILLYSILLVAFIFFHLYIQ